MLGGLAHAAGTASLVLGAQNGTYERGKQFSIAITENSTSDAINVVEADFTYDQAKLQFVGVDGSGSDFDFPIASSGGSGSIQIARGVSAGGTLSSVQKFAVLNFTAIETGSATIVFANSSAIVRPSDGANVWNGSTVGGTYTLTAAPAKPAAAQPTAPRVVTSPAAAPVLVNDQPVPTTSSVSNDGYLVAIQVFEKRGLPISGILVRLDNKAIKTDAKGVASFANIKLGVHTVRISGNELKVTVVPGDKSIVQNFSITGTKPFKITAGKLGMVIASIVLACAAVFALLIVRRRMILTRRLGLQVPIVTKVANPPATSISLTPAAPTVITPEQSAAPNNVIPPTPPTT